MSELPRRSVITCGDLRADGSVTEPCCPTCHAHPAKGIVTRIMAGGTIVARICCNIEDELTVENAKEV